MTDVSGYTRDGRISDGPSLRSGEAKAMAAMRQSYLNPHQMTACPIHTAILPAHSARRPTPSNHQPFPPPSAPPCPAADSQTTICKQWQFLRSPLILLYCRFSFAALLAKETRESNYLAFWSRLECRCHSSDDFGHCLSASRCFTGDDTACSLGKRFLSNRVSP